MGYTLGLPPGYPHLTPFVNGEGGGVKIPDPGNVLYCSSEETILEGGAVRAEMDP